MFLFGFTEYEQIIEIGEKALTNDISKYLIYQGLKSCRGICKAKAQHLELEEAIWSAKSSFGYIFWLQSDLKVCLRQIKRRKVGHIHQSVKQVINSGKGIFISDCQLIESPVINTHPQCTIGFRGKQYWSAIGTGRFNETFLP